MSNRDEILEALQMARSEIFEAVQRLERRIKSYELRQISTRESVLHWLPIAMNPETSPEMRETAEAAIRAAVAEERS